MHTTKLAAACISLWLFSSPVLAQDVATDFRQLALRGLAVINVDYRTKEFQALTPLASYTAFPDDGYRGREGTFFYSNPEKAPIAISYHAYFKDAEEIGFQLSLLYRQPPPRHCLTFDEFRAQAALEGWTHRKKYFGSTLRGDYGLRYARNGVEVFAEATARRRYNETEYGIIIPPIHGYSTIDVTTGDLGKDCVETIEFVSAALVWDNRQAAQP